MRDADEFIARYAGVYENSPWVAEQVATFASDIEDVKRLALLLADCVDNAAPEQQLALIRAHPDLAGKAPVGGRADAKTRRLNRRVPDSISVPMKNTNAFRR